MKYLNLLLIGSLTAAETLSGCRGDKVTYDASGVFETTETIISAKGSGEIMRFEISEGMQVEAGQDVGYLDTTQLNLKRKQLQTTISANSSKSLNEKKQLASLKQQIEIQRKERARFEELVKSNAMPQKTLDDIDYKIEVLERELDAAKEKIGSANTGVGAVNSGIRVQMEILDDQIRNSVIKVPTAGTVLAKYAEPGEFAAPGRALFKIANLKQMKLRAYINASQLTTVKVGQPVIVYADLGESDRREYAGKVVWIADQAEFTPKTIQTRDERSNLVYAIKIAVENDGYIKRGMYGEVKF